MPIHLPAPRHQPGGPDGQGWNRLAIGSLAGDECALRPRQPTKLFESFNTQRAGYGGFGPCIRDGLCNGCPVLARIADPELRPALITDAPRVLFRTAPDSDSHWLAVDDPTARYAGGNNTSWTLEKLAALAGWDFECLHDDHHGQGFWLRRTT